MITIVVPVRSRAIKIPTLFADRLAWSMPPMCGKTIALFSHYLIEGPDERDARSLYFARGVGTTFVPFWFSQTVKLARRR